MRWIDGTDINIKQFTGEKLGEKLALELWGNPYEQWLKCAEFIQVASFLIAFDTELSMEGIFTFLENSIGHYAPNIIQAFRAIGDNNDAEILEEICRLAPPDSIRNDFSSGNHQEYEINTFDENHELKEEVVEKIIVLSKQLYLYCGLNIWELVVKYLDEQIKNL